MHMEMGKHMFNKQLFAMPCRDSETERALDKQALLSPPAYHTQLIAFVP